MRRSNASGLIVCAQSPLKDKAADTAELNQEDSMQIAAIPRGQSASRILTHPPAHLTASLKPRVRAPRPATAREYTFVNQMGRGQYALMWPTILALSQHNALLMNLRHAP